MPFEAKVSSLLAILSYPVQRFRLRYLPLLTLYFSSGVASFSGIAITYWVKEDLNFTPADIAMLSAWITMPWTVKMLFGQLTDKLKFFGYYRKSYLYLAILLYTLSIAILVGTANGHPLMLSYFSKETWYIIAMLIVSVSQVLQDVVADVISVEIVNHSASEKEVEEELAVIQLYVRFSLLLGLALVARLGGYLADIFSYAQVFSLMVAVPLFATVATFFLPRSEVISNNSINAKVVMLAIFYLVVTLLLAFTKIPFAQEIVVVIGLVSIVWMLKIITHKLPKDVIKSMALLAIAIFVYRAMPSTGAGVGWWMIDELKFDKNFFGVLNQIGTIIALVGAWFVGKFLKLRHLGWVIVVLSVIGTLLLIPEISMFYGFHEFLARVTGSEPLAVARIIAVVDITISSPLSLVSMIPILSFVAIYCSKVKENRATFFAIASSFLNLALASSAVTTRYLQELFPVQKLMTSPAGDIIQQADYSNLGSIMWWTFLINITIPVLAVYYLVIRPNRAKAD